MSEMEMRALWLVVGRRPNLDNPLYIPEFALQKPYGARQMGKMGIGYGSEFHLLRYLGYHRHELNRAIEQKTGGRVSDWLDFAFGCEKNLDSEWKGMDFLGSTSDAKSAWENFWPQTGNVPNWDAVGLLELNSRAEYLLVEAKAHVEELRSSCSAKKSGGLDTIRKALETTINDNGFTAKIEDWMSPYYQYANRLAQLHFLWHQGIPARLIFIYFCGDDWGDKTVKDGKPPDCPKEAEQWSECLDQMHDRLGLNGQNKLEECVHHLFLPVHRNAVWGGVR